MLEDIESGEYILYISWRAVEAYAGLCYQNYAKRGKSGSDFSKPKLLFTQTFCIICGKGEK